MFFSCSFSYICFETATVRLEGGKYDYLGNVEVYANGQWRPVCDNLWDVKDAEVVCRQLGFSAVERPRRESYFGSPLSTAIMNNFECIGDEESLLDCNYNDAVENMCGSENTAGVVCKHTEGEIPEQNEINIIPCFLSQIHNFLSSSKER